MRRSIHLLFLLSVVCATVSAQDDALFIEMTDSTLMVFPSECIESQTDDGHTLSLQLRGDTTISI